MGIATLARVIKTMAWTMQLHLWLVLSSSCIGNRFSPLPLDNSPSLSPNPPPTYQSPPDTTTSQAVEPSIYVAKIKTLLTGGVATVGEIDQITQDPNTLKALIDTWMQSPDYDEKMVAFFSTAFQQSQASFEDIATQGLAFRNWRNPGKYLLANLQESFGRTTLALIKEGRPLNETITTRRFQMTVPLMLFYAVLDGYHRSDEGGYTNDVMVSNPNMRFTLQSDMGTIPLAESLNPSSSNYLTFHNPLLPDATYPNKACPKPTQITFNANNTFNGFITLPFYLLQFLVGAQYAWYPEGQKNNPTLHCSTYLATPEINGGVIGREAYNNWKWVTIVQVANANAVSKSWDVLAMEQADTLYLRIPRIGFFTTPSFLGQWSTNASNQMRVTTNQTVITALGQAFTPGTSTPPSTDLQAALDPKHAQDPACVSCHRSLDPMRNYFHTNLTFLFHDQRDPKSQNLPRGFAFAGQETTGQGLDDFAGALAAHPLFATAWTQKLCSWANSVTCDPTSAEFQRISQTFQASGLQWPVLVRELFSSPLVTYAQVDATATAPTQMVPIARINHLCSALSNRLGVTDICGLSPLTPTSASLDEIRKILSGWPSDTYSRGSTVPVMATRPSLFERRALENLCSALSSRVVDGEPESVYDSSQSELVLTNLTEKLMGLSGARAQAGRKILDEHVKNAQIAGLSASEALRSAFVLACLSPSVAGIGL